MLVADEAVNGEQGGGGEAGAGAEVARPEYIPEQFWDADAKAPKAEDLTKVFAEYPDLQKFKTEADTRAAALPKTAADYKIELPKDFKIPEGLKFQVDEKNPLVASARGFADKYRLPQEAMSDLIGMWSNILLDGRKAEQTEADATKQALGAKADERVAAAQTWATGLLGKDKAGVIAPLLRTKDGVEAVETIIAKMAGVQMRGNSSADLAAGRASEHLADDIGKTGTGKKLLDLANAKH